MADIADAKQAEIERVRAAVSELVALMNGRFELDEAKLQALSFDEPAPTGPTNQDSMSRPDI